MGDVYKRQTLSSNAFELERELSKSSLKSPSSASIGVLISEIPVSYTHLILATRLNAGFIPIRKPGKLPAETIEESYDKE